MGDPNTGFAGWILEAANGSPSPAAASLTTVIGRNIDTGEAFSTAIPKNGAATSGNVAYPVSGVTPGRYRAIALPDPKGSLGMFAAASYGAGSPLTDSPSFDVVAGSVTGASTSVSPPGGFLRVRVRDAADHPLPGASVFTQNAEGVSHP